MSGNAGKYELEDWLLEVTSTVRCSVVSLAKSAQEFLPYAPELAMR